MYENTIYLYRVLESNIGDHLIGHVIRQDILNINDQLNIIDVNWGDINKHDIQDINKSKGFIIGGCGYLQNYDDKPLMIYENMQNFATMTCPIIAWSIGYNENYNVNNKKNLLEKHPFESKLAKKLLDEFNKKIDIISVRDIFALSLFAKSMFCPDPAIFFPHELATQSITTDKIKVGLNLANHGTYPHAFLPKIMDSVISTLSTYEDQIDLFYFKHEKRENHVIKLLSNNLKIKVIDSKDLSLVNSWYRAMDICICEMMHSSVMCLNASVPFITIGYDYKQNMFMDKIDYYDYFISGLNINKNVLQNLFKKLLNNRHSIQLHLNQQKKLLYQQYQQWLNVVKPYLK